VSTLAVLGYHKVGPPGPEAWETWYYVPENVFAEQLTTLREEGFEPVDAAAVCAAVDGEGTLPERAALVTFDDGYRSVLEHALPVLQRLEFPAVLFVPTAYVASTNEFDHDVEPEEPLCDWSQLAALSAAGVSVQSHSVTHPAFSDLAPAQRREEIAESKAALEARLDTPVQLFAYPYGDHADMAADVRAALADSGYRAAFGYGGGPFAVPADDRYLLQRLAMGPDTDLRAELRAAA
jgi:peptidoglycan/xylan/chitin deacetylase (PgdA/CDA1 family)